MTRLRFTLRRIMALPLAYAAVFAVCEAFHVPRNEGALCELIGGTALGGIVLSSRTVRELVAAVAAVGAGVSAGLVLQIPCGEPLSLLGAVIGFATFRLLSRETRDDLPLPEPQANPELPGTKPAVSEG